MAAVKGSLTSRYDFYILAQEQPVLGVGKDEDGTKMLIMLSVRTILQ